MLVIIYTVYLLLMYQQHVTEAAQPVLAYWSQRKEKREQKRTTDRKLTQLMGIQGIIKEMLDIYTFITRRCPRIL